MNNIEMAVLSYINKQKWAMHPESIGLLSVAAYVRYGSGDHNEEIFKGLRASLGYKAESSPEKEIVAVNGKNINVIPVRGVIRKRSSWLLDLFGGTSTEKLIETVNSSMEDSDIDGIVLRSETPGGVVDGVKEAADFIFEAQKIKPIVTYVDGMMASAGVYIGSTARKVTAYNTAEIGSIGVWTMHSDYSKLFEEYGIVNTIIRSAPFKATPNPYESLTKEVRAYVQDTIDDYRKMFTADVARYRGVDVNKVNSEWADGKMFIAEKAKSIGLIDEIMTFEDTLEMAADMAGGKIIQVVKTLHINNNNKSLKEDKMTDPEKKQLDDATVKVQELGTRVTTLEDSNQKLTEANTALTEANTALTEASAKKDDDLKAMDKKITIMVANDTEKNEKALSNKIMDSVLSASSLDDKYHGKVMSMVGYLKFKGDDGNFTAGSESATAFEAAFKAEVDDWVDNMKPGSPGIGAGPGKKTEIDEEKAPHADENKEVLAECGYTMKEDKETGKK